MVPESLHHGGRHSINTGGMVAGAGSGELISSGADMKQRGRTGSSIAP